MFIMFAYHKKSSHERKVSANLEKKMSECILKSKINKECLSASVKLSQNRRRNVSLSCDSKRKILFLFVLIFQTSDMERE